MLSQALVVQRNDFDGQRLLRRSAPHDDISLCHCEPFDCAQNKLREAISVYRQSLHPAQFIR